MNTPLQNSLSLIGRVLLSAMFLMAGIGKLTGFAGTVGYISSVGMPVPQLAAIVAIVIEIGGGLALLLGVGSRVAALVLALFTLVASLYFHNYWALPEAQQMVQQLLFTKNIAVIGGLLTVAAFGAGGWSIEGRKVA